MTEDVEARLRAIEAILGQVLSSQGEMKGLLKNIGLIAHTPGTCPIVISLNLSRARQQGALAVIGMACGILGGGVVWVAERLVGRWS